MPAFKKKNVLILFLCISLPMLAVAQDSIEAQLKGIIADAPKGFSSYKGSLKSTYSYETEQSTCYFSIDSIEGTHANSICIRANGFDYTARILKGVRQNKAWKAVTAWKKKLTAILGQDFHLEKMPFFVIGGRGDYHIFTNEKLNCQVTIGIGRYDRKYNTELTISYPVWHREK